MGKPSNRRRVLLAVLLLGAIAVGTSESSFADDDVQFKLDPAIIEGWFTDVDTDSAKYHEYRDLSSGLTIPTLHLTGQDPEGDRVFSFLAHNVRRRDARYSMDYEVAGRYSVSVDYNRIPHLFQNNATFLWTETSPGVYEIADPVQEALQDTLEDQFANDPSAINYTFLKGLLDPYLEAAGKVDVGLQRDRTRARIDLGKLETFSWSLEVTRENRNGTRPYGASLGFSNINELPEPIDYDTSGAELAGEWNGRKAGLRFGLRYSEFDNELESVIWDNPWRSTDSTDDSAYTSPGSGSVNGSSRGRAALAPDNRAATLFTTGSARIGEKAWVSGGVTYSTMSQDQALLPYTINSSINASSGAPFDATDPSNLPARSADGEVRTLNVTTDVGTKLWDGGELVFRYRFNDYDNRSPRITFPGYVRFDGVWEEIARITVPYAYTRQSAGLEIGADIGPSQHLALGTTRESWDRQFREIDGSDENALKLSYDNRALGPVTLRASLQHGDRSTDAYHTDAQELSFVHPEGINNQPGLRKFDEAERTFDALDVSAQIDATDALSLFFGVGNREDDYDESEMGLVSDEIVRYNAEIAFHPNESFGVFAFLERDDRESLQRARQSGGSLSTNPQDDWQVTLDEVTDTWGLGLQGSFAERWSTQLSASWSRSDGAADFFSPPGGTPDVASDFDNYEDVELFMASASLTLAINDHARASIGYRFEDYSIDSFILDGLTTYLPGTILLDGDAGDYRGQLLFANVAFTF